MTMKMTTTRAMTMTTRAMTTTTARDRHHHRRHHPNRGRASNKARASSAMDEERPRIQRLKLQRDGDGTTDVLAQKTLVQKTAVDAHRDMEEWHASDEGKAVVESIAPKGEMSKEDFMNHAKEHITEVGEQPDTLAHTAAPAEPHEIDQTTRWVIATFLNRLIHIPMMNPMTEQIICVKAVDLIADAIERELHRTGAHHFFRDASEHEERGDLEEWLVKISDDLNLIIDVPLMDEKQEYECIHAVLSLITHQYLEKKKRDAENNPIKHKWVLLVNMLG
jgi:hypothetical protein